MEPQHLLENSLHKCELIASFTCNFRILTCITINTEPGKLNEPVDAGKSNTKVMLELSSQR